MAVVAAGSLFLGCARQVSEPEVETPPPPEPAPQEKTLNIPEGGDYPQEFTAKCTRVIDGDTIELENGENVRYIGMDTPEMRPVEAWAKRATEVNRELVEGEIVRLVLDVEERDRYGRLLAYVYVDDTFVNAELVRRGLAQVATYPPNVKHQEHYLKLQREAREEGRGLWSEDAGTAGHADGLVDSEG
jgi:micrococcal nuclease